MSFLAHQGSQFFLCAGDGTRSVPVTQAIIADLRTLRDEGLVTIGQDKAGHSTLDFPRDGWTPSFGPVDAAPVSTPAPVLTDAQVSSIAAQVVSGLQAGGVAHQLTAADVANELAARLAA